MAQYMKETDTFTGISEGSSHHSPSKSAHSIEFGDYKVTKNPSTFHALTSEWAGLHWWTSTDNERYSVRMTSTEVASKCNLSMTGTVLNPGSSL